MLYTRMLYTYIYECYIHECYIHIFIFMLNTRMLYKNYISSQIFRIHLFGFTNEIKIINGNIMKSFFQVVKFRFLISWTSQISSRFGQISGRLGQISGQLGQISCRVGQIYGRLGQILVDWFRCPVFSVIFLVCL